MSVIDGVRKYLDERIAEFKDVIRNQDVDDSQYRMAVSRYFDHIDMRNTLDKVLANTTDDGWFPCDERLPIKEGSYLCTCRRINDAYTNDAYTARFMMVIDYHIDIHKGVGWDCPAAGSNIEILAWKEVKPYGKPML